MNFPTLRAAVAVCLCATLHAAGLKTGDAAPKIRVASWAQGEAVKELEGDKVYIVEFWATWCGPCIQSIPHLNDIHKKYRDKGLVVIGQNLGEDSGKVSSFVQSMGGKMTYRVTVDDKAEGGWMGQHWLTAAGQNGIPCAFVVNKAGKIAYIGHPMEMKESLLEKLLAEPSTKPAPEAQAEPEAAAPGAKALALVERARVEIASRRADDAEATIGLLHDELPSNFGHIAGLLELQLLLLRNQNEDAIGLSKMMAEDYAKKPAVLASVASGLIEVRPASPAFPAGPPPSAALLSAAEKIAEPLSKNAGEAQGPAFATLARIAFLRGDKARAVALQTKSVELANKGGEAFGASLTLETYRRENPPAAR